MLIRCVGVIQFVLSCSSTFIDHIYTMTLVLHQQKDHISGCDLIMFIKNACSLIPQVNTFKSY